ncbi:MAG: hypothetical protein V1853_00995 [bacterium]
MTKAAKTTARTVSRKPKRKYYKTGIRLSRTIPKNKPKKKKYIIPGLYLETLALAGVLFILAIIFTSIDITSKKSAQTNANTNIPNSSIDQIIDTNYPTIITENWVSAESPVLNNVSSTSSLVMTDGAIAMYYINQGKVVRRTSTDGLIFSEPQSTGIQQDESIPFARRPEIADPSVLQLSSQSWLMVYELSVVQDPYIAQIDQPRNLYAARSQDGIAFESIGQILDSSRNDSGYASKPDLVLMPDGDIRLYYISQGDRIASLVSEDLGQTWIREGERISRISYDPDVLYNGDTVELYYALPIEAVSDQGGLVQGMRIRKAIAKDGLNFQKSESILIKAESIYDTINPDVIVQRDGTIQMYYGKGQPGSPTRDLYTATMELGG